MGRREWRHRQYCTHPECKEFGNYVFSTRAGLLDHLKHNPDQTYKCFRHTRPDETLSLSNPLRVTEMSVFELSYGKFWGWDAPVNGLVAGPGFKAYAEDFPTGTRIRVTAELLPATTTEQDNG